MTNPYVPLLFLAACGVGFALRYLAWRWSMPQPETVSRLFPLPHASGERPSTPTAQHLEVSNSARNAHSR